MNMDMKKLIAALTGLGYEIKDEAALTKAVNEALTADEKKDEINNKKSWLDEFKKELGFKKAEKSEPEPAADSEKTNIVYSKFLEGLEKMNNKLDEYIEKNSSVEKTEKSVKIKTALESHAKSGKIPQKDAKYSDNDAEKSIWQKRFEVDFDGYNEVLNERPANPAFIAENNKPANTDKKAENTLPDLGAFSGVIKPHMAKYVGEIIAQQNT